MWKKPIRILTLIDGGLQRVELMLAIFAMLGVIIILTAQVLFRYVLQNPIFFAEEVALILLIIATFTGLSLLVAKEQLVGIELIGPKLSTNSHMHLNMGIKIFTTLTSGVLAILAIKYITTPWVWFERFATVPLPRASLYTIIAIELCLATFHQFVLIFKSMGQRLRVDI